MISCPNCSFTNDDGAKFCKKCGTKLEGLAPIEPAAKGFVCPSCSFENDEGSKFCKKCGTKLEAVAAAVAVAAAEIGPSKEELAKKKAEEAAKKKAEVEAKKKAAAEAKRKADEEAKRLAELEAEKKRLEAELAAKKKAEQEAKKRAEAEAKRKAKEEAARKKKAEAEAKKKAAEEARRKKLAATVTCAVLNFPQVEATKIVTKQLDGSLFKKLEEISRATLKYLPLWKATCKVKKGGLFSKKGEEQENVYLNALSGKVYMAEDKIVFDNIIQKKIDKIVDLDDLAKFEQKLKNDLPKDALKTKTDVKQIQLKIESMFGVKTEKIEAVFLPIWEFKIRHVEKASIRTVYLDGVYGREILGNPFA